MHCEHSRPRRFLGSLLICFEQIPMWSELLRVRLNSSRVLVLVVDAHQLRRSLPRVSLSATTSAVVLEPCHVVPESAVGVGIRASLMRVFWHEVPEMLNDVSGC